MPGVKVASGVRQSLAKVDKDQLPVDGVDTATAGKVLNFTFKYGRGDRHLEARPGDAVVRDEYAKDNHLKVGEHGDAGLAVGQDLTRDDPRDREDQGAERELVRDLHDPGVDVRQTFAERDLRLALVDAPASSKPALKQALKPYPDVKLQEGASTRTSQLAWINSMLAIFYVLLALTVIVSLFGIVNTLVLSVMERTREVGMLRAIGMSRRQTRRMVRHEGIVTAQLGAVTGMAIGVLLGAL